jgi:DNA-binding NtrC family response regulator
MHKKKVLIVEHDIFLMKIMQQKFQSHGYETLVLTDQSKVIQKAKILNPMLFYWTFLYPQNKVLVLLNQLKKSRQSILFP